MRKVDRRLRELLREAPEQLARIADGHDASNVAFDHVCMGLKAHSAERGRDRVLARGASGHRALPTALAIRVNRHALAVWALSEEVADALQAATNRVVVTKSQDPGFSPRAQRIVLAIAGAATATAVAVAIALLGQSPPRTGGEGVLGGGPDAAPPASMEPSAAAAADRSPVASPVTVALAFDDERIGSSWGPVDGNGSAGVVAFPTSFDRSLEVLTEDGEPVETCQALDPTMTVLVLEVDAFLESADDLAGSLSLLDEVGRPLVEVALRADESGAAAAAGARAIAGGLEARAWYRVRIAERYDRFELSVDALTGGMAMAGPIPGADSLGSAHRICVGAAGAPGAAAYYDNLTVISRPDTGG